MEWLIGIAPVVLVLLMCPLMMFFMMRGMHGGHGPRASHHEAPADDRIAEIEQQVKELRDERHQDREKAA